MLVLIILINLLLVNPWEVFLSIDVVKFWNITSQLLFNSIISSSVSSEKDCPLTSIYNFICFNASNLSSLTTNGDNFEMIFTFFEPLSSNFSSIALAIFSISTFLSWSTPTISIISSFLILIFLHED